MYTQRLQHVVGEIQMVKSYMVGAYEKEWKEVRVEEMETNCSLACS